MEKQVPLHEYLRRHARSQPDKTAYIWYGRSISYADLDRQSDAFAACLKQLGVEKGEPVALFMGNCPQYVVAHYGIQKVGAVVCPCGPLFKHHELEYQLCDLGARVIVAAQSLISTVLQVKEKTCLKHVFAVDYGALLPAQPEIEVPAELSATSPVPLSDDCIKSFDEVIRSAAVCPAVDLAMDDVALITYTSGTTGMPKGAMLTHGNCLYKTLATAECNGLGEDDVALAVAPLYHIAGMMTGMTVPLIQGASVVLLHRFEAGAVVQAIEGYAVTWWHSMAPMNIAVLALPGVDRRNFASLRRNPATSFGVALTEDLARRWQQLARNCVTYEITYGLSETHGTETYMPIHAIRWGTQGRAIPGSEIKIVDLETGQELAAGQPGEIVLRNPGVFKGYWQRPDATAATLRSGWVHTGDIGCLDEDGYLTFTGRFKEMIKVSGYPVFPEEVESILIKHPAVASVAAIGVPDPAKGQIVKVFIVRKQEQEQALGEEALIEWARENMSAYKAPRQVSFVDALPTTGAGKVLRRLLT